MVNVEKLQDKIISNPTKIGQIVEALGFPGVKDRGNYYAMRNPDGDNPNAITILKSNLVFHNYTRGKQGNIFTLVMDTKNYSFPQALEWICDILGENKNGLDKKIEPPFGGFYKIFCHTNKTYPELSVKTYDEEVLPSPTCLSKLWINDGVDFLTQEKFGIRYDLNTNGLVIPEYSLDGHLVGAKWRNADPDCNTNERWGMYIPFQKSYVLYGLNINYPKIISKRTVIIVESEKAVCQLYSWGCGVGIAIGGHNLSLTQVRLIKSLMCDEIIVAFDEGICEEEIVYESKKLIVDNMVYKNKVFYLFDRENKYLEKDSKNSPTDLGADIFKRIMKECKNEIQC